MLPSAVKVHKFQKNIDNEEDPTNRSINGHRRVLSTSQTRKKLFTGALKHRIGFNFNFTAKNSQSKRYVMFKGMHTATQDFDPSNVHEGIADLEIEIDEIQDAIEKSGEDGIDQDLDELIEGLVENNRKLLWKVNAVAEVVAAGVVKAAKLKNSKLLVSHREGPNNKDLRDRKTHLNQIHAQIATEKRKIEDLEFEIDLSLKYVQIYLSHYFV